MKYTKLSGNFVVATLAFLLQNGSLLAQGSLNEKIIGTWTYVHNYNEIDGKRIEPQGPEGTGKGILIFDSTGRFVLSMVRADIPKFTSNNRQKGTEAENRAVSQGAITYFGGYKLDSNDTITMSIEFSSFPNFNGTQQKRSIKFEKNQLIMMNQTAASGGTAYLIWQRTVP